MFFCSDNLVIHIHNSVRSGRSRRELLLSAFVGVSYLGKQTHSSKNQSSQITPTCKFQIVIILKNYVLYLSDLTDLLIDYSRSLLRCFKQIQRPGGSGVGTEIWNICRFLLWTFFVTYHSTEWYYTWWCEVISLIPSICISLFIVDGPHSLVIEVVLVLLYSDLPCMLICTVWLNKW